MRPKIREKYESEQKKRDDDYQRFCIAVGIEYIPGETGVAWDKTRKRWRALRCADTEARGPYRIRLQDAQADAQGKPTYPPSMSYAQALEHLLRACVSPNPDWEGIETNIHTRYKAFDAFFDWLDEAVDPHPRDVVYVLLKHVHSAAISRELARTFDKLSQMP